jgi:hypothetical protein
MMFLLRIVQYRAPGRIDVNNPSSEFCHKNRVRHWRTEVLAAVMAPRIVKAKTIIVE